MNSEMGGKELWNLSFKRGEGGKKTEHSLWLFWALSEGSFHMFSLKTRNLSMFLICGAVFAKSV